MSLTQKILLLNLLQLSFLLSIEDIPEIDKYYTPEIFSDMDLFNASSQFSWERSSQSAHFFVFWENDDYSLFNIDIDSLLNKAEKIYDTNVNKIQMLTVNNNSSYLEKYKLQIYITTSIDWSFDASGFDNVIGALTISAQYLQTIDEHFSKFMAYVFQYQLFCDQILQGITTETEKKTAFKYGYENSNDQNGFYIQTAQYLMLMDYPERMFTGSWFEDEWLKNNHRHFEHEYMTLGSYWLFYYLASLKGNEVIGNIWKNAQYPEDAIQCYTRIYNNDNYETTREELFDYALKMATYDIDGVRDYAKNYQGMYSTKFYYDSEGYYQIAYENCPGATGFNVIELKVPSGNNKEISVEFVGLKPGVNLANDDPGDYYESYYYSNDSYAGNVSHYNTVNKDNIGWRYGFVFHLKDDSRVYSRTFSDSKATESIIVLDSTKRLYFVVQGSPESYIQCPWDDRETTDAQFPYKVRFTNTDLVDS